MKKLIIKIFKKQKNKKFITFPFFIAFWMKHSFNDIKNRLFF